MSCELAIMGLINTTHLPPMLSCLTRQFKTGFQVADTPW